MKTDSKIQEDVIHELKWDPSVTHERIGVAVTNGIVTLSGSVPTYVEKSAAEKAAQRVAGVKAVVEKIEVRLSGLLKRDDQDIANAIINQFKWNVQVPAEMIKARVENGWVYLTGEVEWDYQRSAAEHCVRGLTGVKSVSNNITLKQKDIQATEVRARIEDALKREAVSEAKKIIVELSGTKVILKGNVHSFAEVKDAKWAAWSAPGVTTVDNQLQVSDRG